MPERQSLITENIAETLSELLGRKIEYCTDEGNWEEVYLSGFDSRPYSPFIEIYPPYETAWGQMWHRQNDKIPFPFPGHDARLKVTNPERLRLLAVEAGTGETPKGDL